MNVFIMTDLEGVSNIDSMEMIDPKGKDFPYCQQLMMEDLNAAVEGAKRGGAEKIYTVEGHFDAFAPEKADPRVTIVTMKEWEDVIRSGEIDVYMEVGAHAKAGTMHGFLDHTMSSLQWYKYSINGQQMSEVEINALFVGAFGIPVVMVSGDAAVCRDVQATLGEVAVAPVKKATSRNRAICLPREEALRRICDAAEAGMHIKKAPFIRPYPLEIKLELCRSDYCEATMERVGDAARRTDARTVERTIHKITSYDELIFLR
ncbi:MAG: hypothetical protein E7408_03410 [Ruminococcaceae bacterium]|nr:hypothetical protein [Oscillospiraceae bacterium]